MDTFIARQPIFDNQIRVYGYELLFRRGIENFYDGRDSDEASLKVIVDSCLFPGAGNVTEGKRAFLNFTRTTLLKDCAFLLPKEFAVIELLETVKPDPDVIEACQKAKAAGYTIALDDFADQIENEALTELADIIKVDFLATSKQQQQKLAKRFGPRGISLCAEKVETWGVYNDALAMGYSLFQGYFFGRPVILTGHNIPANKLNYLYLIREIHRPDLRFSEIEELIRYDLSLAYKLLRYLNSAAFGFRREIGSVRQAVAQLGEQGIRKWVTLIALVQIANDCPSELVRRAIVRAAFCESVAKAIGLGAKAEDLYLLGIFSCLDAILGRNLSEILEELSVAGDIQAALLGDDSTLGNIYQCVLEYEAGNWDKTCEFASKLKLEETKLPAFYRSALIQAAEIFKIGSARQAEPVKK